MDLKYIVIILLFTPLLNRAQNAFVNNKCSVYIQKGALVEVVGNLVNDSGSATSISNDGTIELSGNFVNNSGATFGVYNNSNSTERLVKFMGTGTQTIQGSMSSKGQSSFYNLVVDQASGSDSVQMQTNVVVEGSIAFGSASTTTTYNPSNLYTNNNQKGLLQTYTASGEYVLQVTNGNTDAISGYPVLSMGQSPTTGYILTSGNRGSANGGLQRSISSATSYLFPIGTNGRGFNGVELNFSKVPGNGSVTAKFCDGSSNPGGYVGIISAFCAGCENNPNSPSNYNGYNRYFESDPCNGGAPQWVIFDHTVPNHGYWSLQSTNTGYQYDMEVFPNSYPVDDMGGTMRVLKYEASYGYDPSTATTDWRPGVETTCSSTNDLLTYSTNTGCYSGSGVPGGLYTDFCHFSMGGGNSGGALPVTLLYIKAAPAGKYHIEVTWATALEINNAGFDVMRSSDGVNFSDLGWVNGHDNSTVTETYSYDDKVSQENVPYYYKLKQVDNNGNFVYSNVAEAMLVQNQSDFAFYPNPTTNDLFITINNPGDEMKVVLYDMTGRAVYDNIFTTEANTGSQTVSMNIASVLPPGTYVVSASTNGQQYSGKLVLQ